MNERDSYAEAYPALVSVATQRARRILWDSGDADDIAQETLLRAYQSWADIEMFAPQWVSRVAVNLSVSKLRRRHAVAGDPAPASLAEAGVDLQLDLAKAVGALPLRQRQVVVLRHLADLPERKVAELLGISAGSVKRHLHRAITELRSPTGGLGAYSPPTPHEEPVMTTSWKTRFPPATPPPSGWPVGPWDHRYLRDDEGRVDRVAVDPAGAVILDADGDEVQSGPGFDYEVAKVVRDHPQPDHPAPSVEINRLVPEMAVILGRAMRMAEVFGHSWVGTEHLALALVEHTAAAEEIIGATWEVLAGATSRFYEGPYAEDRVRLVVERLRDAWQPTPLPNEVAAEYNRALVEVLERAIAAADQDGRAQAGITDVARQLMAPRVHIVDGRTFNQPSLVPFLLER